MTISTIRPRVAQLSFQVFQRALHPELFQVTKSHRISRQDFSASIDITNDGHIICWKAGSTLITEVAASVLQPLPKCRCIVANSMNEKQQEVIDCRGAIYRYEHELERVKPEMFWLIQQQLGESAKHHELIQVFDASGRMAIGGMSFIHVETRLKSLRIQAIHTFPDDLALVKIQSTFTVKSDASHQS